MELLQNNSSGEPVGRLLFAFMHLLLKTSNHVALLLPDATSSDEQKTLSSDICRFVRFVDDHGEIRSLMKPWRFSAVSSGMLATLPHLLRLALADHPSLLSTQHATSFRTMSDPRYCGKMKVLQGLLSVFLKERSKVLLFSLSTRVRKSRSFLFLNALCTHSRERRFHRKARIFSCWTSSNTTSCPGVWTTADWTARRVRSVACCSCASSTVTPTSFCCSPPPKRAASVST